MRILFATILLAACFGAAAQPYPKSDHVWMLGAVGTTLEWYRGLIYFDFSMGDPVATEIEKTSSSLRFTRSTLCDSTGKLLLYTNGCNIHGGDHEIIENGTGLNEGGYGGDTYCPAIGYQTPQSTLLLPWPGQEERFLLLHLFADKLPSGSTAVTNFLATSIDMSANDGKGQIIEKNMLVSEGLFAYGKLTACRHANGRDWWLPLGRAGTANFDVFLLDSTGISLHHSQQVGQSISEIDRFGQAAFSPDGSFFARFDAQNELDIFRFDRCRGLLFAPQRIDLEADEANWWGCGVAFSPNSRYLYASSTIRLHQFDLAAADIPASKLLVGEYDGFVDFQSTTFYQQQLAPDGRIYMCCTNEGRYLHVINNPNAVGVDCDFQQHSIQLPNITGLSLPNFPNMDLGPATSGYCDSIGLVSNTIDWSGITGEKGVFLAPNPAHTGFEVRTLNGVDLASVTIYDMAGRRVQAHNVAAPQCYLNTGDWPNGIYFVNCRTERGEVKVEKIVVQH